jgi:hypothetical protein
MKTFLTIFISAAVTWFAISSVHGIQSARERAWLISAIKTPGGMALSEIQADINADKIDVAKAKLDVLLETWREFESGPDSCSGSGIGNVMVGFSRLNTNNDSAIHETDPHSR